jgi:hypothetical protein
LPIDGATTPESLLTSVRAPGTPPTHQIGAWSRTAKEAVERYSALLGYSLDESIANALGFIVEGVEIPDYQSISRRS